MTTGLAPMPLCPACRFCQLETMPGRLNSDLQLCVVALCRLVHCRAGCVDRDEAMYRAGCVGALQGADWKVVHADCVGVAASGLVPCNNGRWRHSLVTWLVGGVPGVGSVYNECQRNWNKGGGGAA
ncbi:hypothetical protein HaLaN_03126, partial [Haematococcus lacustris]